MSDSNNTNQPQQTLNNIPATTAVVEIAAQIPVREFINIDTSSNVEMFKGHSQVDAKIERKSE